MSKSPSPVYAHMPRRARLPDPPVASARPAPVPAITGVGFRDWRPFTIAAVAAALASMAFIALTALRAGGDQATITLDDIGEAVAAMIAAFSCGLAAFQTSGRNRIAWAFFAASAASWGGGEVAWSVYEVGMGVAVPFPSVADIGFLLAIPFGVMGVFAFTAAPSRLTTRGEALLAGTIIALSLLFVAWALGLSKVYDQSAASPASQLIGLAYPAGDMITITVLVLALRRARRTELGRMFLLLGGLAAIALSDSTFAYLTANGSYQAIGSVLDAGWVIGFLMIALAPLWPSTDTEQAAAEGPIELWQLGLPWAAVFIAAITALGIVATNQVLDRLETVLAGSLGVLLVGSQILSHRDSLSLLVASRRAEKLLERRNDLLNEIVNHAPIGIARVATDMRIIDVNPRMSSLMRVSSTQLVGKPIAEYLDPIEFTRVFEVFQPLWKGQVDSVESDSHAIRADLSTVWLHWSATTVRSATGHVEYFLVLYEDTDAEHAANQAAIEHLAGIERLNQLKSEFITLVSHEFRTGLVGIQGFSEMIRDADLPVAEIKSYAGDINNDAQRLNRMINDMLDLDRIEAGRLVLRMEKVNVNAVLQEAVERTRASSLRHTITTNLDSTEPVVTCDEDRLAQIISNLLTNAIKYSPDGGEIDVTSRVIEGFVQIGVRDNGVGIAPDFVKRLFNRYERYEKTRGKVIGTGLGLAIAKQIVEMQGGRIWVESTIGAGSQFHFTLPLPPTDG